MKRQTLFTAGCFFAAGADNNALVKTLIGMIYGAIVGWITLVVTGLLVASALLIKRHYNQTALDLRRLDELSKARCRLLRCWSNFRFARQYAGQSNYASTNTPEWS